MKRAVIPAAWPSAPAALLLTAGLLLGSAVLAAAPAAATATTSTAPNFSTEGEAVVCGVAVGVQGTAIDPGTMAPANGRWPGLQCQTTGLPRVSAIGDPAVQLGQGSAGRARLLDISQDELLSDTPYMALAPGTRWTRYGIACTIGASSIRCTNGPGYGFIISPGDVQFLTPVPVAVQCASVSYTFPHTHGHGHAALNNLTAVDLSCARARSVARSFLIKGSPPAGWHATSRTVIKDEHGQMNTVGEEILTRGAERVTGEEAN